jgi:hypothetical protein
VSGSVAAARGSIPAGVAAVAGGAGGGTADRPGWAVPPMFEPAREIPPDRYRSPLELVGYS